MDKGFTFNAGKDEISLIRKIMEFRDNNKEVLS